MRANIIVLGVLVTMVGLSLLYYPDPEGFVIIPIGILNIVLGVATPKSTRISFEGPQSGPVKLLVDKGVFKTSIYQVAFLDKKLVLKRLASVRITILLPLALALGGFLIVNVLTGVAAGFAGYSIQEFVTQRRRNKIAESQTVGTLSGDDLEFPYSSLNKVTTRGNSLLLFNENGVTRINLPRGYGNPVRSALESVLPALYRPE